MCRFRSSSYCLTVVSCTTLFAGCANDLKLEDLQAGATGTLAALPAAASSLIPTGVKQPVGSATEVYTRIARGALTCWMGAHSGLKKTHLFQARAQPRSAGGAAQIAIHERIKGKPNQPGRKVFSVSITPIGSSATVSSTNDGLPEAKGEAMRADVDRWAAAEEGCLKEPIDEGWAATSDAGKSSKGKARKSKRQTAKR
ncbi:MAG: hypothetical protein RIC14_13890 [Filomicrobium sp.]